MSKLDPHDDKELDEVEEMSKITLDDAIEILKENYEIAEEASFVRKPISWALYSTWEEVNREEK